MQLSTARLVSSFAEGEVTEVVEGKAWVVPGVLSPEVSQLSVGSPFLFSHSHCLHGGAIQ